MIGLNTYDAALAGIEASMQAAMPHRVVQRSLVIDPMTHDPAALAKGVNCLVAGGGGQLLPSKLLTFVHVDRAGVNHPRGRFAIDCSHCPRSAVFGRALQNNALRRCRTQ